MKSKKLLKFFKGIFVLFLIALIWFVAVINISDYNFYKKSGLKEYFEIIEKQYDCNIKFVNSISPFDIQFTVKTKLSYCYSIKMLAF